MKVQLTETRDLLARWNEIGRRIMSGNIVGLQVTLLDVHGNVSVQLGGAYQRDTDLARKAALLTAYQLVPSHPALPVPHRQRAPRR